jgi:hypothetical protein
MPEATWPRLSTKGTLATAPASIPGTPLRVVAVIALAFNIVTLLAISFTVTKPRWSLFHSPLPDRIWLSKMRVSLIEIFQPSVQ